MAAAPRYKLKLTKLDFLSLVDKPAQQTATIRLIKRAGVEEMEASMLARIVKVGEGADPLIYCWAFTCTDDKGQPYHDLQGDAVSADFIKVAEEWMRQGAAVDEMHDGEAKSRVAFAFPMDADIASAMLGKAAGEVIKVSGLMVAIRPTPEQLEKARTGEYTGVSIAGAGLRELVKSIATPDDPKASAGKKPKRKKAKPAGATAPTEPYKRVGKAAALTSEDDGHRHSIDLSDPADEWWSDRLSTSSQTAEGAEQPHSHAWTYDPATGKITIGADSGHTHTVDAVVPADVLAEAAEDDDEKRCPGCGSMCDDDDRFCCCCGRSLCGEQAHAHVAPAPAAAPAPTAAPAVVVVTAHAPAAISTPVKAAPTVTGTTQENAMDPKFVKMLNDALALPEVQRLHLAKLASDDQAAFLGLDAAGRDAAVKAADAADPEVYKTAAGTSIRKSHGALAEQFARQNDATAAELKKQAEQLEVEKAERERVQIEKRATDLIPLIGKSLAVRVALVKSVDGITDKTLQNDVVEALKGANAAFTMLGKSAGVGDVGEPGASDIQKRFEQKVTEYAKANNLSYPEALIRASASDPEIRDLYNQAQAEG